MSLPPKEAEKAEKEVTNMEDSGHGQDIGSDTLLGDSRVMDTSEEEEEEKISQRASRRPRRSRVSYKVRIYSYA